MGRAGGANHVQALDLCNGGMIWSCCVPRDQVLDQVIALVSAIPISVTVHLSQQLHVPSSNFPHPQAQLDSQHAIENASKDHLHPCRHVIS